MNFDSPNKLSTDAWFKIFVVAVLVIILVHLFFADWIYLTIRDAAQQLNEIPNYDEYTKEDY